MSNYGSNGGGFYAGPRQDLIARLQELVQRYPEGIGIIKELIQNADDAGARVIRFTFDWRTHSIDELPLATMTELMGPALLVYNDKVFSEQDFKGIQEIGIGGKRDGENLWKTGKFGLGFNSVYNITDYPSFVSQDRIIFFDPHRSVLGGFGEGWGWHLQTDDGEFCPNLLKLYKVGLPPELDDFNNTVFRFPLRTAEQASRSGISENPFDESKVEELLNRLRKDGEEIFIFLKNLEELQVYKISETENDSPEEVFSITTKNSEEVRKERQKLLFVTQRKTEEFLQLCKMNRQSLPSISYKHEIEVNNQGQITTSIWRVSSIIRVDENRELIEVMDKIFSSKQKGKAIPWAGAAVCIESSNSNLVTNNLKGNIYCFLPLPRRQDNETGLHIHINGYFDLESSRRHLTSDDQDYELQTTWNRLLANHVLSYACANLITSLVQDVGENKPDDYYSLWPVSSDKLPNPLQELPNHVVKLLHEREVIRTTGNRKWCKLSDIYVLPEKAIDLMEPLCAEGLTFPDPPLPTRIIKAFTNANLSPLEFTPRKLRDILRIRKSLGVALSEAPKPCLLKWDWIINLLRYCLQDKDYKDLKGVPLAILADETLQVFGYNPPGFIYLAKKKERDIFVDQLQWFLHPDLEKQISEIQPNAEINLLSMTPAEVVKRLSVITGKGQIGGCQWQPDENTLPNANWLTQVYRYFTQSSFSSTLFEQLKDYPIIPGSDGKLHQASHSQPPLLCGNNIDSETREALKAFGILFIEAPEPLKQAIEDLSKKPAQTLITLLSPIQVIENLHSQSSEISENIPVLALEKYSSLLDFLTNPDRVQQYTKEILDKLCELRIFPTESGELVTLSDRDVYIPGDYEPPTFAGKLNLLQLGTNRKWKRLLDLEPVPTLNRVSLIEKFLRAGGYSELNANHQLEVLAWIRDELEKAKTDLRKEGKNSDALMKSLSQATLVHCTDSKLRSASQVYDPNNKVVCNLFKDILSIPDIRDVYSNEPERWLRFFKNLGMKNPNTTDSICKLILPQYDNLSDTKKVQALEWIRDHIETVESQMKSQGENFDSIKQEIANKALVRCTDGKLHPAISIYDPTSSIVQDILGERVFYPDIEAVYSNNREKWLDFFRTLGMSSTPSAKDFLDYITILGEKAYNNKNPNLVARDFAKVFEHLVEQWDTLKYQETHGKPLNNWLRTRRWLPVLQSPQELQQYPAAMTPELRLYCPSEVAFIEDAYQVASQRPLFKGQCKREVGQALGFKPVEAKEVVAHFEKLIVFFEQEGVSDSNSVAFNKSLEKIYEYFYKNFIKGSADGAWVKQWCKNRPCLWHKNKFWKAEHAFQQQIPFGKRRLMMNIDSPIREVYEFLGLKPSPSENDYLDFLEEVRNEYGDKPLNDEDAKCVVKVLQILDEKRFPKTDQ